MGRIIKLKNNPVITPDVLDRVVGWPPLVRWLATPEQRDAWLAKVRGVPAAGETISAKRETKMQKCGTCGRWRDPSKTLQRKSKNACRECGRGHRKEREK